jgi:ribosome-binding factor A
LLKKVCLMPTRRQRRVSELIHRELSLLLMREARDPRLGSVTLTGVDVSPDLLLARVHFSVLGGEEEEQAALAGFGHAAGFLRSELAGRVRLRFVPELTFKLDKSSAYGQRIDQLLEQIKASEGLVGDATGPNAGDAADGQDSDR